MRSILVIANLSRFVQAAELDLSELRGMVPVEIFGQTEFPSIGELPYFVTLGPHAFYWFSLEQPHVDGRPVESTGGGDARPFNHSGLGAFSGRSGTRQLESKLPKYVGARRWFGSKSRKMKGVHIVDSVPMPYPGGMTQIAFIQIDFVERDSETYRAADHARIGRACRGHAAIGRLRRSSRESARDFPGRRECSSTLYTIRASPPPCSTRYEGVDGCAGPVRSVQASPETCDRSSPTVPTRESLKPSNIRAEQSNSSITFDEKLMLKLYRKHRIGTQSRSRSRTVSDRTRV